MKDNLLFHFNRPNLIEFDSIGRMFVSSQMSNNKLFCYYKSKYKEVIDLNNFELSRISCVQINNNDEILVFDNVKHTLVWFDKYFNLISKLFLEISEYSAVKYNKSTNSYYLIDNLKNQLLIINNTDKNSINRFKLNGVKNFDYKFNSLDFLSNEILALDSQNYFLVKFDLITHNFKKKHILPFGRDGKGSFRSPLHINSYKNFIIIIDSKNYLVQFFNTNMKFQFQIGGKGYLDNNFDLPVYSTIYNDHLYICDFNNDRVVMINESFSKLIPVLSRVYLEGKLNRPSGIAYCKELNMIFIADRGNALIQIFDNNLNFVGKLNNYNFIQPASIAIIKKINIYYLAIIDRSNYKNSNFRIYKISNNLKSLKLYSEYKHLLKLNDPQDLCLSNCGTFFVADTLNRRIIELNCNSQVISELNLSEITKNPKVLIKCVFVNENGLIFTADFDACIVYVFDPNKILIKIIDFSNLKNDIKVIRSVFSYEDKLILCVRGLNQILITDFNGKILNKISSNISWNHPVKIISGNDRLIYILDKENDRVVRHNLN